MWNRMILTMRMLCVVVMVMLIALLSVSCTSDPEIIEVTRIVENVVEVVKEVEVIKEIPVVSDANGHHQVDAKPLVIYSGRSESLVDPLIEDFSELTGIEVQVNYAKTGPLAATLLEEGDKTPADIFFAQDPGGLGAVDALLTELPNDLLIAVPEWARDPENKWVGTSGRAR
ncbi:MAG: hypothetical protein QGI31_09425, partial [Dehalococcoidia bacterium]|nr:hypothetical protein [Dehalococcoidia bacterium]